MQFLLHSVALLSMLSAQRRVLLVLLFIYMEAVGNKGFPIALLSPIARWTQLFLRAWDFDVFQGQQFKHSSNRNVI
jgi:hypothetical protein